MVVLFLILEAKKEEMQTIREKRMLHILCFTVFICMKKKVFELHQRFIYICGNSLF